LSWQIEFFWKKNGKQLEIGIGNFFSKKTSICQDKNNALQLQQSGDLVNNVLNTAIKPEIIL